MTFRVGQDNPAYSHGCGSKRKGISPEYCVWQGVIQRCTDANSKDYPRYGGRGVTVCGRWRVFKNFLADMGPRPPGLTLDRIDNSGNYEPGNCRWATREEQARNTRRSVHLVVGGTNKLMKQWCEELGLDYRRTAQRIRRGWSPTRALELEDA